jgi:hypothetical protein
LSNIVKQKEDLLGGIDLVSMMMLRSNSVGNELERKPEDSQEIEDIQGKLRERIINLYTLIIKFQIEAAYSFCSNIVMQGFKDWKGTLDPIIQSEKYCWDLINKINADRMKRRLDRQVRI